MRLTRLQKLQIYKRPTFFVYFLALLLLAGCATTTVAPPEPTIQPQPQVQPQAELTKQGPMIIETRPRTSLAPLATLEPRVSAAEKMPYEGKLFSLSARSTPMRDVLLGLSKQAELNLVLEKGVNYAEPISVELHDLPLSTALDMVLNAYGYFYDIDGSVLRVKAVETKIFHFDYPLIVNTPSSSVGGDMLGSSGGQSGGSRGSSSDSGNEMKGEFSIETSIDSSALDLWKQLEQALKGGGEGQHGMLSEQGRVQINKLSGTIMVTDRRENLILIEEYLNELQKVLRRQITIEAKIIEVTLNDDYKYGIKWDVLAKDFLGSGGSLQFISDFTTGGGNITMKFLREGSTNVIGGFIEALSRQGNVSVLSSPRISTLNNQTALISVARNVPYIDFELSSIQDPNDELGRLTQLVPTMKNARVGISLGVTPQIDENGVTTLHIVPVITDLVGFKEFTLDQQNWEVPVINMRATDSIVRARDGSTIVLGGLILERVSEDSTAIPVLGDIPYFGQALFSGQAKEAEKRELVIMLNPTIIEQ
jgi:MSHA type pilus biogenesis protein MshL